MSEMINNKEEIARVKRVVGQFYNEVKSNSITDFIIWLDCKLEYEKQQIEEHRMQRDLRG